MPFPRSGLSMSWMTFFPCLPLAATAHLSFRLQRGRPWHHQRRGQGSIHGNSLHHSPHFGVYENLYNKTFQKSLFNRVKWKKNTEGHPRFTNSTCPWTWTAAQPLANMQHCPLSPGCVLANPWPVLQVTLKFPVLNIYRDCLLSPCEYCLNAFHLLWDLQEGSIKWRGCTVSRAPTSVNNMKSLSELCGSMLHACQATCRVWLCDPMGCSLSGSSVHGANRFEKICSRVGVLKQENKISGRKEGRI